MTMLELANESTLLGAIDRYISVLSATHPKLAKEYTVWLDDFAKHFLAALHPNDINTVATNWIKAYLVAVEDRHNATVALVDFFNWASRSGLISTNPTQPFQGGFAS